MCCVLRSRLVNLLCGCSFLHLYLHLFSSTSLELSLLHIPPHEFLREYVDPIVLMQINLTLIVKPDIFLETVHLRATRTLSHNSQKRWGRVWVKNGTYYSRRSATRLDIWLCKAFYTIAKRIHHLSRVNCPQAGKSNDFSRIGMKNMCTRVLRCGCKVTAIREWCDGGEHNVDQLVHHAPWIIVFFVSDFGNGITWNRKCHDTCCWFWMLKWGEIYFKMSGYVWL